MSVLVVITRPELQAQNFAKTLQSEGWDCLIEPMLSIQPVDFSLPNFSKYQALVFTSANGVRVFAERIKECFEMPVFVVGEATKAVAQECGFANVLSADGDSEDLEGLILDHVTKNSKLILHVRGEHIARDFRGDIEGVKIEPLVVYEAHTAREFSVHFLKCLDEGQEMVVTFFSKRTAETFLRCAEGSGNLEKLRSIKALCISEAVLECVRNYEWAGTYTSQTPDRSGMVKLLRDISG